MGFYPDTLGSWFVRRRGIYRGVPGFDCRSHVGLPYSPACDHRHKSSLQPRARSDLSPAVVWICLYGVLLLLFDTTLTLLGQAPILILAIPAAPVFAWHLWLVSRREERQQAGVEILATGVLTMAAPTAYWVVKAGYQPLGWLLWLVNLAPIHRQHRVRLLAPRPTSLENRSQPENPSDRRGSRAGLHFLQSVSVNRPGAFWNYPAFHWVAFLIQALETVWCALRPAVNARPVAIGMRQLAVTVLFTIIFIVTWR